MTKRCLLCSGENHMLRQPSGLHNDSDGFISNHLPSQAIPAVRGANSHPRGFTAKGFYLSALAALIQ